MNIFNRNTKTKHLEQFEIKIAELLSNELPELRKVIEKSKLYRISFMENPSGILLTRSYSSEEIKRNNNSCFNLYGLCIFEKKTKKYVQLKLAFFNNSLNQVEVRNPKELHKNFDLNNIKIENIKVDYINLQNPDKEIVLNILKKIDNEKLNLLDLENTFEIEIGEKSFFTILDMEDGNYIAIDKQGKVYRLNHDQIERVKIISESVTEFFNIYSGEKMEIEKIINR